MLTPPEVASIGHEVDAVALPMPEVHDRVVVSRRTLGSRIEIERIPDQADRVRMSLPRPPISTSLPAPPARPSASAKTAEAVVAGATRNHVSTLPGYDVLDTRQRICSDLRTVSGGFCEIDNNAKERTAILDGVYSRTTDVSVIARTTSSDNQIVPQTAFDLIVTISACKSIVTTAAQNMIVAAQLRSEYRYRPVH